MVLIQMLLLQGMFSITKFGFPNQIWHLIEIITFLLILSLQRIYDLFLINI